MRYAKAMVLPLVFVPPLHAQEAVVLVYHRFGEDNIASTNIRLDQFEAQLDWLAASGAHFPTLENVITALQDKSPLPDKSVVFTVDDAYRSAALEAWPRLKARGIPMVIFVSTQAVDDGIPGYLSWDELRALKDEGVFIGFHGHSHHHMAYDSETEVMKDLRKGVQRFATEIGTIPPYFAYPYGEYSTALMEQIRDAGFEAAFAQYSAATGAHSPLFALPRFAINERYGDLDRFKTLAFSRPIAVEVQEPADALITQNPPVLRFRLLNLERGWRSMSCYPSHLSDAAELEIDEDGTITVDLGQPLPFGRSRVNCTYLGVDRRWRWFGQPFFVKGGTLD